MLSDNEFLPKDVLPKRRLEKKEIRKNKKLIKIRI